MHPPYPARMGPSTAPWPRAAVSCAIFRAGEVLLIERGKGALAGLWSLPGGHIEPGETAHNAALRELAEETGVVANLAGVACVHDVILRDASGVLAAHYVISVFAGTWQSGVPHAASDARQACFVALANLGALPLTEGAERVVANAAALLAQASRIAAAPLPQRK